MRHKISSILMSFLLLAGFVCSPAAALEKESIDPEIKKIANQVIMGIYKEVLSKKSKFKELVDFDESVIYENKYGIYALVYKYEKYKDERLVDFYELGITVLKTDDQMFNDQKPFNFNIGFPKAGIKFAGYFKRDHRRRQYDFNLALNAHGFYLDQYQQQFMPLRLFLKPVKDEHIVDEPIQFEVELKNVSLNHMWVKSLDSASLFCLFNNKAWGTYYTGVITSQTKILKAGESIVTNFVGESISKPDEVPIFCSYNLAIDTVQPSGLLKVKVVDKPKRKPKGKPKGLKPRR